MIEKRDIENAEKTMRFQLGISPEQHAIMVYDKGMEWLEENYSMDRERIARWERSKRFWNWWKHQWALETYDIMKSWGFEIGEIQPISEERKMRLKKAYPDAHTSLLFIFPSYILKDMIIEEVQELELFTNT